MSDDPGVIDKGWDALPAYSDKPGDGDDAVTLSISTTPGEWLVNTNDAVVVPMSMIEVVDALRSQRLNERSLVWRAGMQEWAPVEKVPQLKLAARLPSVMPAPSASPARAAATTKPPKPARASSPSQAVVTLPPPRSAPSVTHTPLPPPATPRSSPTSPGTSPPAQALRSRKATLPFGLPAPSSNPRSSRPTPRPALPPPGPDDSEVLAVYDRPAATISFAELVPEVPAPAPASPQPQTLAPITTDSSPRRAPVPPLRSADLSVVAARDFRQAQQFSKRLIFASSAGSALVASLLTLWLSGGDAQKAPASAPPPVQTLAPAAPVAPPPTVSAAPPSAPVEASASAEPPLPEAPAKPKPKRQWRAWKPPVKTAPPAAVTGAEEAAPVAPKADTNPYDVQLEEDAPPAKPPSSSHGSGLPPDSVVRDESAPTTPGF
jgi:hypothetical protein